MPPNRGMHYDDNATILVVEDDDATRTFLADNLTADGFELLVADCAKDGIRLIETKFPDLALIDVGLPDGSGLDLVHRVRDADGLASRVDPRTPLLLVSGRDSELDRIRGFERGADDYVCKPIASVFGVGSTREFGDDMCGLRKGDSVPVGVVGISVRT